MKELGSHRLIVPTGQKEECSAMQCGESRDLECVTVYVSILFYMRYDIKLWGFLKAASVLYLSKKQ